MKKKQIKRLRRELASYIPYEIYEQLPNKIIGGLSENCVITLKAKSPWNALERYIKYYGRKHRKQHYLFDQLCKEVHEQFAQIGIKNTITNFITYYG